MEPSSIVLKCATLVPGTESPIGDGYTGAMRCIIQLPDQTQMAAVLKRIPFQSVLAEAFSSLLLKAWGLNVPEPYLIKDSIQGLSFASADATYPSLKQKLGIQHLPDGPVKQQLIKVACDLVANLPQTPLAMMADEAIDNRDRNLGNILWDGANETWIDHELTLGLAKHMPEQNKLALMVTSSNNLEAIKASSIANWMSADRNKANTALDSMKAAALSMISDPAEVEVDFANLVAQRLASLGNRLLSRFPTPNDLFSQAP